MSSFSASWRIRKGKRLNNSGLQKKLNYIFLSHKCFCWLQGEHELTNRVLLAVNQEQAAQKNPDSVSGGSTKAVLEKGDEGSTLPDKGSVSGPVNMKCRLWKSS